MKIQSGYVSFIGLTSMTKKSCKRFPIQQKRPQENYRNERPIKGVKCSACVQGVRTEPNGVEHMENVGKLYFVGDVVNGRYQEPFRSYEDALERYYDDIAENLIIETERDKTALNSDLPARTQEEILDELAKFYFVMVVHYDTEGDEISSRIMLGEGAE
jgi:hypothetical protein